MFTKVELVKGKKIVLTTDAKFKESCTAETLYLDYKNITKVIIASVHFIILL